MRVMQLAIQVAGALAAGGLVLILVRQAGLRGRDSVGAVAVVPVVAACLLALPIYREQISELLDMRKANAALTTQSVTLGNGEGINADVDFLAWAKGHLSDHETFGFVIKDSEDAGSLEQWALFQMAPYVAVEPSEADWIVLYDVDPAEYAEFGETDIYQPGFAIMRNRLAG